MYRYLSTFPHIHYDKTMKDNVEDPGYSVFEERSQIMRITSSDGLEDLSAADKTELLLKLVEDIHDIADIKANLDANLMANLQIT